MRNKFSSLWLIAVALSLVVSANAQEHSTAAAVVPRLVSFSGHVTDETARAQPGAADVTFTVYKDQFEGTPLWSETQRVSVNEKGEYTAQLGATLPAGVPVELFTSGEARWLGVRVNANEEQPRQLLVSVPYALKAVDAQTLGGLPASAFLRASPVPAVATDPAQSQPSPDVASPKVTSNVTTPGGAAGKIAVFNSATSIQSSAMTQTGSGTTAKIGVGVATPATTLDVNGAATVRGTLALPATGAATAAAGKTSQAQSFIASSFENSIATAVAQTFQWKAEPVGNNTANPSGSLNLLFGVGASVPAETGLKINSKGLFTFAPGQQFPGTGAVKSVGLAAPSSDFTVTGSPVTGNGTLTFAWNFPPSSSNTANAIVKRDATGSFTASSIIASASVEAASSNNNAAVAATNTSTGYGVYSFAAGGPGVWGESLGTTSNNGIGPDGVHGVSHNSNGSGVAGMNSDSAGIGTYGQGGGYGVYGVAANQGKLLAGGVGVYGGSIRGAGVQGTSTDGAGVSGTSYLGAGVSGTSTLGSAFYANGNVSQVRTGGGWVKAMALVYASTTPYTIAYCFNSTALGTAATTPPCGINFTEDARGIGYWNFDFGFDVHDRFIAASLESTLAKDFPVFIQASPANRVNPTNVANVYTAHSDSSGAGAQFYIFVY